MRHKENKGIGKGNAPSSRANLWRGNLSNGGAIADEKTRQIARQLLDASTIVNGKAVTTHEAIIMKQVEKALQGDLLSAKWLLYME